MFVYDDLSPAQKRWVDLVELLHPEIKEKGTITYAEVQAIHAELLELRKKDARFKCAMPWWLTNANTISRGVYQFPATDLVQSDVYQKDLEGIYISEMQKRGLKPKRVIT